LEAVCATALALAGTGQISLASVSSQSFIVATAPLLVLIGALSALVGVLFGGWTFSVTALMPDFAKLSPSHGLGQVFSVSGITDTLKSVAKFLVIGGVGGLLILSDRSAFAALSASAFSPTAVMVALCLHILVGICAAIIAIAGVDVGVQFWLHRRRHRMSDQELRDEMKEVVGNPHVRQRQRAIARRMARSRQMRRVPEASVIITNPTHFAVAIRFRRGIDAAPILLAKGAGFLAAEIVIQAQSHGIPIVEAPPLARAIYRYVEPDDPIPVVLYRACAEVLAYVWRLQQWRAARDARQKPIFPKISSFEIGHRASE
jgi:flagellar biosynthetic protein FlhB